MGQPISMLLPPVVGFKLHGKLREGCTATDLVLTVTQMLRKRGVVGKFVEFYGAGLSALSLADRATVANMAPEYGATIGFFPVDEETLNYLRVSNRDPEHIELVEAYCKEQGLFRVDEMKDPYFRHHAGTGSRDRDSVAWPAPNGRRIASTFRTSKRISTKRSRRTKVREFRIARRSRYRSSPAL